MKTAKLLPGGRPKFENVESNLKSLVRDSFAAQIVAFAKDTLYFWAFSFLSV